MSKSEQIIKIAESLIGAPYEYGAYLKISAANEVPKSFDCSSFIQYVFHQTGISLPRSSILQATKGIFVQNNDLRAGDVIFYEGSQGHYNYNAFGGAKIYIGHAAIYAGNRQIIHALEANGKIINQNGDHLPNPPYNIVFIKRFYD